MPLSKPQKYLGKVSTPIHKKKTPNDDVMTSTSSAKFIIDYFKPTGKILEPCMGTGSFYNQLNGDKDWCEIKKNKDFFEYDKKVDWIITNPPFSIYDNFLLKSFELADNVVFFCPLVKAFKGKKLDEKINEYGGLKEIVHMGSGGKHNFPFGFSVGCLHYVRNYYGDIKYTRKYNAFI